MPTPHLGRLTLPNSASGDRGGHSNVKQPQPERQQYHPTDSVKHAREGDPLLGVECNGRKEGRRREGEKERRREGEKERRREGEKERSPYFRGKTATPV